MSQLLDIAHTGWGGDIGTSTTGDLATVSGDPATRARIIRRLLTNPGDYIARPDYGGGIRRFIGSLFNASQVQAIIIAQLRLESGVAQSPAPTATVTQTDTGVIATIQYYDATTGAPVVLSVTEKG